MGNRDIHRSADSWNRHAWSDCTAEEQAILTRLHVERLEALRRSRLRELAWIERELARVKG